MAKKYQEWKRLPDEQAWWWYWIGSDYTIPHICSVMVSKTGTKNRYFVADGSAAAWCDEMEGFWLKIEYPNVPSRAEQKHILSTTKRSRMKSRGRRTATREDFMMSLETQD